MGGSVERQAVLRRAGLLDTDGDPLFDRATRIATSLLGTPVALVSIVDDDRQVFVGREGLAEPWSTTRETPLTHSVCQFLVEHDVALGFDDLRDSRWVRQVIDVDDLGVGSYLGVPLRDDEGQPVGSFCVIDSTPRRWTQEDHAVLADLAALVGEVVRTRTLAARSEASARDSELELAGVAHDLRGEVSAVRGSVETLASGRLDPDDQRRVLDVLDRRTRRLSEQLASVLATTRDDVDITDVMLAELAEDVATTEAPGRDVTVDVPADLTVTVDRHRLRRVLANLVSNAAKHGGPGVTITVRADEDDGDLRLVVADDGPGFGDLADDEMFEAFARGDRADAPPGHGLGLYVVRRLVERMGGSVRAGTSAQGGAEVEVRVPSGR